MKLGAVIVSFALGFSATMAIGQALAPEDGKLRLEVRPGDPVRIVRDEVMVVQRRVPAIAVIGGIWVVLEGHNGFGVVISQVLPDGPAAKAGLQPGQIITEVDGTRLEDLTEEKARSLLNGPAGTAVRLEVMDPKDSNKTVIVHLMRKGFQPRKVAVAPPNPKVAFVDAIKGQQVFVGPARPNLVLEPVAQFSPTDEGAEKAIREALTKAGMAFSITEGDPPYVRAQAIDAFTVKEILEKLRARGHWSVTPLSTKDGKTHSPVFPSQTRTTP